jgi:hypothetical protein
MTCLFVLCCSWRWWGWKPVPFCALIQLETIHSMKLGREFSMQQKCVIKVGHIGHDVFVKSIMLPLPKYEFFFKFCWGFAMWPNKRKSTVKETTKICFPLSHRKGKEGNFQEKLFMKMDFTENIILYRTPHPRRSSTQWENIGILRRQQYSSAEIRKLLCYVPGILMLCCLASSLSFWNS